MSMESLCLTVDRRGGSELHYVGAFSKLKWLTIQLPTFCLKALVFVLLDHFKETHHCKTMSALYFHYTPDQILQS